jgi:hypothetical protein
LATDLEKPDDADRAWRHIAAEQFDLAEPLVRRCIASADPTDHSLLWHLHGWLASVLNSLSKRDEANLMLSESLRHARAIRPDAQEINVARYLLANQELLFGDPAEAVTLASPVPGGVGHIQCLLHSVIAESFWKLDRQNEARLAAQQAVDSAPEERRPELEKQLAHLLETNR